MTDPNVSPDGYWRWNGAQWVPNVDARGQAPAPAGTPGRREWVTGGVVGGVVGAAVLAPVVFPDTNVGDGLDFGSFF